MKYLVKGMHDNWGLLKKYVWLIEEGIVRYDPMNNSSEIVPHG